MQLNSCRINPVLENLYMQAFWIVILTFCDESISLRVTSPVQTFLGWTASFSMQLDPYPSNESIINIRMKGVVLMRVKGTVSWDVLERLQFTGNTFENRITFTLRNVTLRDAGTYSAIESVDPSGEQKLIVKASASKPQIILLTDYAVSGSDYRLKCSSVSNSAPPDHGLTMMYDWKINDQLVKTGDRYKIQGSEFCIARLTYGQDNGAKLTCVAYEDPLAKSVPSEEYVIYVKFTSPIKTFVGLNASFNLRLDPYPSSDSLIRVMKNGIILMMVKGTMSRDVAERFEFTGNTSENRISFVLRNVMLADAGIYSASEIVYPFVEEQLIVKASPAMPQIIALTDSAVLGSDLRLNCSSVSNSVPPDHGLIMMSEWKINEQLITIGGRYKVQGTELTIASLTRQDNSGRITCVAYEDLIVKSVQSNEYIIAIMHGPDNVNIKPSDGIIMAIENRSIIIRCMADCNPTCGFQWRRESVSGYLKTNQTLMINSVDKSDTDNYTCTVSNSKTGRLQSLQTTLNVIYGPDNIKLTPSSGIIMEIENRSIIIRCSADCNPTCAFQWRRESVPGYLKTNQTLMIDTIGKSDADNYTCTVSNSITGRSESLQTQLAAISAPRIIYVSPNYKGYVGQYIMIQFDFYSDMEENLTVTARHSNTSGLIHRGKIRPNRHDNLPLYSSQFAAPGFKATILISIMSEYDFGYYDIEVKNYIGSDSKSTKLTEQITPEKPINFHAANVEEKQISLKWLSGYDAGFDQAFIIEISPDNTTWLNVSLLSSGIEDGWYYAIVVDLLPGSEYFFRLYSYNVNGRGDFADVQLAMRTLKEYACLPSIEIGASIGIGVGGAILGLIGAIIAFTIRQRLNGSTHTCIRDGGKTDVEMHTYSNTECNPQTAKSMYEELHRGNIERNIYDQITGVL